MSRGGGSSAPKGGSSAPRGWVKCSEGRVTLGVFNFMQRHADRSAGDLKHCMPVKKFARLEPTPTLSRVYPPTASGYSRRYVCAALHEVEHTYSLRGGSRAPRGRVSCSEGAGLVLRGGGFWAGHMSRCGDLSDIPHQRRSRLNAGLTGGSEIVVLCSDIPAGSSPAALNTGRSLASTPEPF